MIHLLSRIDAMKFVYQGAVTEYLNALYLSNSKNISDVKKGEPKKVQVTERLKVWNHCEAKKKDIPARLCRTPAYKAS